MSEYQVFESQTVGGRETLDILGFPQVYGLAVDGKVEQTTTKEGALRNWDALHPEHQEQLQRLFDEEDSE